jgi:hypothetical protein
MIHPLICWPDLQPRVRLIAVTATGDARVYTLDRPERSKPWTTGHSVDADGVADAFADPDSSIVIEINTGFRCKADNHGMMTAMDPDVVGGKRGEKHWAWIIAGAKSVRVNLDVTGDRLSRVEWPVKAGTVVEVKMVERTDASALVAFTDRCQALVYSLPGLELMHMLDLPYNSKMSVHPYISYRVFPDLQAQRSRDLCRHYRRLPFVDCSPECSDDPEYHLRNSLWSTPVVLQVAFS